MTNETNDSILGNHLNNEFTGNAGNDSLDGAEGSDIALYKSIQSDYKIEVIESTIQITSLNSNEGIDTLSNIEYLQFSDTTIEIASLLNPTTIPTTPAEVDITPAEGDSNHINYFLLQISGALSIDASVNFQTQDGTAKAGEDYIATSGTSTILAGELSTVIGVEIIGDQISEQDETFFLAITNPQGGIFPTGMTEVIASRTIIDDDLNISANNIQIIGINHDLY